ncbi:hypothetical protein CONPUDRAFT_168140 [Coniophora puteana RWD-64-598 SS2]|uniref:Snurportin-1 n=1 Tax=Coniophora puteana (strain RWD-64-598) TaxID=741705 RepID=A0A5M3MEU1_CONPW|nr:uncharacterized protein CONPUDRAFT_168140 [Coniophora puteana RWD-64-598 SS2]EIW77125.1 hypothetical protein CONPUDRAFT_168140 [Coniophora puteana RWD-64-598 SS2]
MGADRKSTFKTPPTAITDKLLSQEARRVKALDEQKRRRAQRVDSSRHLDAFADLTLGPSDDELEGDESKVLREPLSDYAKLLTDDSTRSMESASIAPSEASSTNSNRKRKQRRKKTKNQQSKWADRCMYAELLELKDDNTWESIEGEESEETLDGLPRDLEGGWVAVAPVPVGKRCLAITHQSTGVVGTNPNTALRSRLLGKMLIPRFPSALPPLTVIDCILDPQWRDNGIIHVLDVIKWKGQDVGDCETPFRFWWRDMRLAELPKYPPPSSAKHSFTFGLNSMGSANGSSSSVNPLAADPDQYRFPYPTTFVPVPYHIDTTLPALSSVVIPSARLARQVVVDIPSISHVPRATEQEAPMDLDARAGTGTVLPVHLTNPVAVSIQPDGLLLYVARASYEPGLSPLSCWVPNRAEEDARSMQSSLMGEISSPLELFERRVYSTDWSGAV